MLYPRPGKRVRTEGVHDTVLFGNDAFQATDPFATISHDSDAVNAVGAPKRW